MDLILWRHAEAEEGTPDAARKLTPKGERQAQKMAKWLKTHLDEPVRILVSPARRAQQTALTLSEKLETRDELATGSSASRILRATGWPDGEGTIIVVGHQPTFGQLAALLLSGKEADWNMKKGAIWWFETQTQEGKTEALLRAVLAPREV
jgi:phosphohistidine phosphatase